MSRAEMVPVTITGNRHSRGSLLIASIAYAVAAAWLPAATINVPADHATIQGAIDAAATDDMVIVAPGTYNEFININKRIILVSSGGAAVTTIQGDVNNDTPIVDITAPGVSLGAPDEGFTINQLDPGPAAAAHAGNCAVRIRGELVSSATAPTALFIEGCTITGNQSDEGLLVNQNLTQARLVVRDCTFVKNGGAYSFKDVIHFHYSNPGGQLNTDLSANECTITFANLTLTDFDRGGVYFHESIHKTTVTLFESTFAGLANSDAIHFADSIMNFSTVTNIGLTVNGGNDVLYVSGDVSNQSALGVFDLVAQGFHGDGIYISGRAGQAGTLKIEDSVIAGDENSASYGVYANLEDGSTALVDGCTISGIRDGGIYFNDVFYGSTATIANNSVSMFIGGSGYGILTDTQYGSTTIVRDNIVRGFDYAGIFEAYPYAGCSVAIERNVLTADAGGSDYGIYVDEIDYGSVTLIENNTISGFSNYGLYIAGVDDGSRLTLRDNMLTAAAGGASSLYGIYFNGQTSSGSVNEVIANTISGILDPDGTGGGNEGYGVYLQGASNGSSETAADNVIAASGDGDIYGIYGNSVADDGSTFDLLRNQITGATQAAIFLGNDVATSRRFVCTDNKTTGGEYGIYCDSSLDIRAGSNASVHRNVISGFTDTGLYVGGYIWGSMLEVNLNKFTGTNAGFGIVLNQQLDSGGQAVILKNCISGVATGVRVQDNLDTSLVAINLNDLSGTTIAIENVAGDVAHTIDGESNFFGAATPSVGNVATGLPLAAPPDEDADGVIDCADKCPNTTAGQPADADGCSCQQLSPDLDTDADGTIDCLDGCPTDPSKIEPGVCGCGDAETDTDGDTTPDCSDACPADSNKVAAGTCGCGVADTDTDGDTVADCLDECPNEAGSVAGAGCPEEIDQEVPACGAGTAGCGTGGAGLLPLGLLGLLSLRRQVK